MQTFFIAFGQGMNYSVFEPKFAVMFCKCLLSKQDKKVCPKHFVWFNQAEMEAISNLHIYSKTHSHKLLYTNGSDTKILSEHLHYSGQVRANHSSEAEFAWSNFYILTR